MVLAIPGKLLPIPEPAPRHRKLAPSRAAASKFASDGRTVLVT
jgi:hypothetical protein